jgi:integrase
MAQTLQSDVLAAAAIIGSVEGSSFETYEAAWNRFINRVNPHSLEMLTEEILIDYAAELPSFATAKSFINAVKLAWGPLSEPTLKILSRVLASAKKKNPPQPPKYSRMHDLRLVLKHISSFADSLVQVRNTLMLLLAFDTGLRSGGLYNLRFVECKRDSSFLIVRTYKPKEGASEGRFGPWMKISAATNDLASVCSVRTFDQYKRLYLDLLERKETDDMKLFI